MGSVKTTPIEGDVTVSRNAAIGGEARIAGNMTVGHNVVIKGWLDAPNVKGINKGIFLTKQALREAYPNPHDGWLAGVGTSTPFDAYIGNGGDWVPTGGVMEFTVDLGQFTGDLENLKEEVANVSNDVGTLTSDVGGLTTRMGNAETSINDLLGKLVKEISERKETDSTNFSTLRGLIDSLEGQIDTLVGDNASEAIENFNEVIAFLQGVTDDETLTALLSEMQNRIKDIESNSIKLGDTEGTAFPGDKGAQLQERMTETDSAVNTALAGATTRFHGISDLAEIEPEEYEINEKGLPVWYDITRKMFYALHNDNGYRNFPEVAMYSDKNFRPLKDKIYLYNNRIYLWDDVKQDLVPSDDGYVHRVLSEDEYDGIAEADKHDSMIYMTYEDEEEHP